MKHLFFALMVMSLTLASCSKDFTRQQLLGTWNEIQPCIRGNDSCYDMTFTSANNIYETSPDTIKGQFVLVNSNTILIDSSVIWVGYGLSGYDTFQLAPDGNKLTIKKFYTPFVWTGSGAAPVYDLQLQKL
jgi:hypothetical protein